MNEDHLVDIGEAADILGFARNSLKMYRYGTENQFGRFNVGLPGADYTIGNKPLWRLSTLDTWCRAEKRGKYRPGYKAE